MTDTRHADAYAARYSELALHLISEHGYVAQTLIAPDDDLAARHRHEHKGPGVNHAADRTGWRVARVRRAVREHDPDLAVLPPEVIAFDESLDKPSSPVQVHYVLPHEATYKDLYKDRPDEIQIRSRDGGWELSIAAEPRISSLKIQAFRDAFRAFHDIPELFEALAVDRPQTIADVRAICDRLGIRDATDRPPADDPHPEQRQATRAIAQALREVRQAVLGTPAYGLHGSVLRQDVLAAVGDVAKGYGIVL